MSEAETTTAKTSTAKTTTAETTTAEPTMAETGTAKVHDLGYQRYGGTRRAQATRHRIIARKTLSAAWRGWWRMKVWVLGAAMTVFVISVVMYVSEGVSRFMRGGVPISLSDALLPMSFPFFEMSAFAMALTLGAGMITGDLRTGAFEFYFSRPVRAKDYVAGKILGLTLIMAIPLFFGPVLLALVRIGLSSSDDLLGTLHVLPKAAVVGFLASAAYALVPLAFSAISSHKRHTLPAFAAFYFITSILVPVIVRVTDMQWLEVFDMPRAVHTLAYAVFDIAPMTGGARPSGWIALVGLLGHITLAVWFVYWRVSAAEKRGMGGG